MNPSSMNFELINWESKNQNHRLKKMRRAIYFLVAAFCLQVVFLGIGVSSADAASSDVREEVMEKAKNVVGVRYVYGSESPSYGFDASGLVYYIYQQVGVDLARTVKGQAREGESIDKQELQEADLLFFGRGGKTPTLVGIYTGEGQFIASASAYGGVTVKNMNDAYYVRNYLGARRVLPADDTALQSPLESSSNPRNPGDSKDPDHKKDPDNIKEPGYTKDQGETKDPVSTPADPVSSPDDTPASSSTRDAIINAGLKYLGVPYKFGSTRNDPTTFDCSDFVRTAYYDAMGIVLPSNSRTQAQYVQENGTVTTDWKKLKKGDIMFFTSLATGKIYHDGIYMGDGKILHTYSVESGGVRIDTVSDSNWLGKQFTFGGSIINE